MKTFEEIKQEILKRAKENNACEEQYKRAYQATSTEELLSVVKDNLRWAYTYMDVNAEFLEEYFGSEFLNKNHIYTQGEHTLDIKNDQLNIFTLGSSSANIKTLGSSSANIETWDSSSANVKTWDSSSANVKTWDSSSANIETWDSSSANVKTCDSSSANVKTCDSSSANVKTCDSSSANVKTCDSSSANVKTWDSSSANIETWGSSSKIDFQVISKNSFIRNRNERKIYIKKNSFEIVEI